MGPVGFPRPIRIQDAALVNDVRVFIAGLTQASLASKEQWKTWIQRMMQRHGSGFVTLLLNASQQWLTLSFVDSNEYHQNITEVLSFYKLQFATNDIVPDTHKGDWENGNIEDFFLAYPVASFILAVHLGGPLREYEVGRMLKKQERNLEERQENYE